MCTVNRELLLCNEAEHNGPGIYSSKSGKCFWILCWNPNNDPVIEQRFQNKLVSLNRDD